MEGSICSAGLIVPPAVNKPNGTSGAKRLCRTDSVAMNFRLKRVPLRQTAFAAVLGQI